MIVGADGRKLFLTITSKFYGTQAFRPRKWMLGVPQARQQELEGYQVELDAIRQKYRLENATTSNKKQLAAEKSQKLAQVRDTRWNSYISELKRDLQNPNALICRDRPRCRPMIAHRKSAQERQQGLHNVAHALANHQIAKRKYLALLRENLERPGAIITPENLDAKIQAAIANPRDYNMTIERMLEKKAQFKSAIKAINVPIDRNLRFCEPQSSEPKTRISNT